MIGNKIRILIILLVAFLASLVGIVLYLLFEYMYPFIHNLLYVISSYTFLIFVDLIVAEVLLIIYLYHLIIPIKTLRGKTIMSIILMILGAVMIGFPLFIIIYLFSTIYVFILEGLFFFFFIGLLTYGFFLIPGLFLIYYGWQNRKLIIAKYKSHSINKNQKDNKT